MTTRIEAICSLIERCETLADIGCDHGFVASYAHSIGCKEVIASDISETSVEKAKLAFSDNEGVSFVVSDGFKAIKKKVDLAVIAGMGGKKIAEILETANYLVPTLVLGPQHDADFLREYLVLQGYYIDADFMAEERGKFYSFIRARLGKKQTIDDIQRVYGVYYKDKNPALKAFALKQRENILRFASTEKNAKLLTATEEVLKWQL